MRILLASPFGLGAWFMLRLMREGHSVTWYQLDEHPHFRKVLKGLIPPPVDEIDTKDFDFCIFDCTGHGDLADEISADMPVIGDGSLATALEDDRLYGIQVMEEAGIEVPAYKVFSEPESAKKWIEENPAKYVYKPFTPPDGEEQESDTTYVACSPEDLLRHIDQLYKDAMEQPFLLQEVVEGEEISTEGYFDGQNFHFHNHTLEEKKFMAGGYGPNTGCSGNLVWTTNGPNRLFTAGLGRLQGFLRHHQFRGMVDLNTIVNEGHAWGLEWTPRFGYDSSASIFSTLESPLGQFLYDIASGVQEPEIRISHRWAASVRITIPPYPEDFAEQHPSLHHSHVAIKGVKLEDAWRNWYLYDAMADGQGIATAGINGNVVSPIAAGHSPEGAWCGIDRMVKEVKIPDMQMRCDLKECTLKRLDRISEMGWI